MPAERAEGSRTFSLPSHFLSGKPFRGAQSFCWRSAMSRKCYESWVVKSWAKGQQAGNTGTLSKQAEESVSTGDMRQSPPGQPTKQEMGTLDATLPTPHRQGALPATQVQVPTAWRTPTNPHSPPPFQQSLLLPPPLGQRLPSSGALLLHFSLMPRCSYISCHRVHHSVVFLFYVCF